jgi:hypothetical protein
MIARTDGDRGARRGARAPAAKTRRAVTRALGATPPDAASLLPPRTNSWCRRGRVCVDETTARAGNRMSRSDGMSARSRRPFTDPPPDAGGRSRAAPGSSAPTRRPPSHTECSHTSRTHEGHTNTATRHGPCRRARARTNAGPGSKRVRALLFAPIPQLGRSPAQLDPLRVPRPRSLPDVLDRPPRAKQNRRCHANDDAAAPPAQPLRAGAGGSRAAVTRRLGSGSEGKVVGAGRVLATGRRDAPRRVPRVRPCAITLAALLRASRLAASALEHDLAGPEGDRLTPVCC